jgi:hypothetical protein
MAKVVLLDTGPLGMVTHPRAISNIVEWLEKLRSGMKSLDRDSSDAPAVAERLALNAIASGPD